MNATGWLNLILLLVYACKTPSVFCVLFIVKGIEKYKNKKNIPFFVRIQIQNISMCNNFF